MSEKKSITVEKCGFVINPVVFFVSAGLIVLFVAATLLALDHMSAVYGAMQGWIVDKLGWLFILLVSAFLVFNIALAIGRFGSIRLGGPKAKPNYSVWTWFAMLFSAGMGIGLVFWGVAEPVMHFNNPPIGPGDTVESAQVAMRFTLLHWGLHAWAIYGVVALCLAYFAYNRGMPLTIRSVFYPLFGDRIYGSIGNIIDILAVLATLFGVATSLGLGVSQIAMGVHNITGIKGGLGLEVGLIAVITILACISVVSGLNRGIKRLSQFNLSLASVLLVFVLIAGPTIFILKLFVQSFGGYLQHLMQMSLWTDAYSDDTWQQSWTVFYWAWWISWSPYVGMFIARISYGRTIRQFLSGVLLAPTVLTVLWFAVFGGTALHGALNQTMDIVSAVNQNTTQALFSLFANFPFALVTSTLVVLSVTVFFITSSDSASLVIDMITSGGSTNPPTAQRVFWATTEGVVAAFLLIGGGLSALQTAAITTGLPFAIILVLMCVSLVKALREDHPLTTLQTATHRSNR